MTLSVLMTEVDEEDNVRLETTSFYCFQILPYRIGKEYQRMFLLGAEEQSF